MSDAETSEDDTHPTPGERIRLGERVNGGAPPASAGAAWDLFPDPTGLKDELHECLLDQAEEHYDLVREPAERAQS